MNTTTNDYSLHLRYMVRIVFEAKTPLQISSGNKSIMSDSVINRDVNGLPFVPGTTLAGLLRHAISDKSVAKRLMGYQESDTGEGSRLIVSEAKMLGEDGTPIDGIIDASQLPDAQQELLAHFSAMPIRQHVCITHRGVAAEHGKYDEEVVPRGVRFCFDMELRADDDMEQDFLSLLNSLASRTFRIGGGGRSGFGRIQVISILYRVLDLSEPEDLNLYLHKSSNLSKVWGAEYQTYQPVADTPTDWDCYLLRIRPDNFIFFGSGFGNEKSDKTYVSEGLVEWTSDNANGERAKWISYENNLLIPASSVKGALAHRTAYHYNKFKGIFADSERIADDQTGLGEDIACTAVRSLFGSADENNPIRGNVLFSDIIIQRNSADVAKTLNHVKIDRFTGGSIDGALFSEEVLYAEAETFDFEIDVHHNAFADDDIRKAFEEALKDICKGLLPLGGSVNRGNGTFHGSLSLNNKEIYDNLQR